MNARTLATLSVLLLTGLTAAKASADETDAQLAWQQPGYVMEVVVATAPRPKAGREIEASTDAPLARLEPGYVEEVVVVTASRREPVGPLLRGPDSTLYSSSLGIRSTRLHGRVRLSSCAEISLSQAVVQALVEPGRQKT